MRKRYMFWEIFAVGLLLASVVGLPIAIFRYHIRHVDEQYDGKIVRIVARNDSVRGKPGLWMVQKGGIWNYHDKSLPNTFEVEQGEKATLLLTSVEVVHEFSLAGHDVQGVIYPGKVTVKTFVAGAPGEFKFECTNYCGEGHEEMVGALMVVSKDVQTVSSN